MAAKQTEEVPFSITIQGFEWSVQFVNDLAHEGTPLSGLADPDSFTIYLRSGMSPLLRRCVFLHEFNHACVAPINQHDNPMLAGYVEEESAVEMIARGMAELIEQRSLLPGWVFVDGKNRKVARR